MFSFFVLLISISARIQLLNPNYWTGSFRTAGVYSKLDDALASEVEKKLIDEGASKKDAQAFSSFFTSSRLQDFTEKNIVNILDYINAKTENLVIYFPLDQIPRDIREDLNITTDQISVSKLISTFGQNSTPAGEEIFIQLRTLGNYLTVSLIIAIISILIHLVLLDRIETAGSRLAALSVSLIASGVGTLALVLFLNIQMTNMARDLLASDKETIQIILGTLAPPLIFSITKLWTYLAIGTIVLGCVCFFLKRK